MKKRDYIVIGAAAVFIILFFAFLPPEKNFSCAIPECYKTQSIDQPKSLFERIRNDPVAAFTLLFTGGLFWATYALFDATKKLVAGAEKTAAMQLRAYILPGRIEFQFREPESQWAINVTIRNTGQTPAYDVVVSVETALISAVSTHGVLPIPNNADKFEKTIVSADGVNVSRIGSEIRGMTDIFNFRRQHLRYYVWGHVEYKDIFGEKHFTHFQFWHVLNDITQFAICGVGNTTDDVFP